MNWKFWSRKKPSEDSLAITKMKDQLAELSEQLAKLTRLQYKSGQDVQAKLERMSTNVESVMQLQAAQHSLEGRLKAAEDTLQHTAESLIRWLDDLDHMVASLQDKQQSAAWHNLLEQWAHQLIMQLALMGIQELDVLGRSFDPRWAESVQTVKPEAIVSLPNGVEQVLAPYAVVRIVRRGFVRKDGSLLRKAQVITVEEEKEHGR